MIDMSLLKQIKKTLTFEEICPIWHKILTGQTNYTPDTSAIDIADHKYCIVGEAHGFKSRDDVYDGCEKCDNFSYSWTDDNDFYHHFQTDWCSSDVKILTESELANDPLVKDFVNHWNEEHLEKK